MVTKLSQRRPQRLQHVQWQRSIRFNVSMQSRTQIASRGKHRVRIMAHRRGWPHWAMRTGNRPEFGFLSQQMTAQTFARAILSLSSKNSKPAMFISMEAHPASGNNIHSLLRERPTYPGDHGTFRGNSTFGQLDLDIKQSKRRTP